MSLPEIGTRTLIRSTFLKKRPLKLIQSASERADIYSYATYEKFYLNFSVGGTLIFTHHDTQLCFWKSNLETLSNFKTIDFE